MTPITSALTPQEGKISDDAFRRLGGGLESVMCGETRKPSAFFGARSAVVGESQEIHHRAAGLPIRHRVQEGLRQIAIGKRTFPKVRVVPDPDISTSVSVRLFLHGQLEVFVGCPRIHYEGL
jgi:hypothetical protein